MPGWLIAIGGGRAVLVVVVVFVAAVAGGWLYVSGRSAAQVDGLRATVRSVGIRNEIDNAVDRLPDGAAADRLRRDWSRD